MAAISLQNDTPLVSICIPTRDGGHLLRRTLESIVSQGIGTNDLVEVIISDNHSGPKTVEICESFAKTYKFVRVIRPEQPLTGDLNSGFVLRSGRGTLLKLVSDNSKIARGSLTRLLEFVKFHSEKQLRPALFFPYVKTGLSGKHINLDTFVKQADYWPSLIGTYSCWRDDFHRFFLHWDFHDKHLAHYASMLTQIEMRGVIIYPELIFTIFPKNLKGGYSFFEVFIDNQSYLLNRHVQNGALSEATAKNCRRRTALNFCTKWHARSLLKYKSSFELNSFYPREVLVSPIERLHYYMNLVFNLFRYAPLKVLYRPKAARNRSLFGDTSRH